MVESKRRPVEMVLCKEEKQEMKEKRMTRREFLKVTGIVAIAGSVTCCGGGALASRSPEIDTKDLVYGKENKMSKRILVTYATKAGSTADIAAKIGEHFGNRGYEVDVINVNSNPNPSQYDAVILGSCVRMGNWLPDMLKYVETNQTVLQSKQCALFTVHMMNVGEDESSQAARLAYLDKVRGFLPGSEEVYFLGAMDFSKLSMLDRFISKMVKAEESDERDWIKIQQWAEDFQVEV